VIKGVMAPPDQAQMPDTGNPQRQQHVQPEALTPAASAAKPAIDRFFRARMTTG
jgi:hypothetical protein